MPKDLKSIALEIAKLELTWLVTGCAGFIGSHLVEELLKAGQKVVGLDNFVTGHQTNLDNVQESLTENQWSNFKFIKGDICSSSDCLNACKGIDIVLHQAALGSVPRSIADPISTTASNVQGFVNLVFACKEQKVRRIVYASSSSVYGDSPVLPKKEDVIGTPLSPYALSKLSNEQYAEVFSKIYGLELIGLRYFNVFGARQDPHGPYSAVIPRWISELLAGKTPVIYGDGKTSRDFCYVKNAVKANLLAGIVNEASALNQVYNVSAGARTSLIELYEALISSLTPRTKLKLPTIPNYQDFRAGDVAHSQADITKISRLLDYTPDFDWRTGLELSFDWYIDNKR